ncbi:MAG: FAD-dependent oxidoreductase [bacterium]|nr:FAD-dependent oxidoreductase [bacterium]
MLKERLPDMTTRLFQRQIPVRKEVDVFVAGGGPAGIAASLAAARQGCSVYLAEGQSCLGGMCTAGLVPGMLFFGDGKNLVAGGIGREIYERLCRLQSKKPYEPNNVYLNINVRAEVLKKMYDEMILEAGIDFTFMTQVIGVDMASASRISHAICSAKSGIFAVKAQLFIDCTGDGDLAAWAGAQYEKGDSQGAMMPGTICSLWAGIDWGAVARYPQFPDKEIHKAIADGLFSVPDRHLPGILPVDRTVGGGNIGHNFGVDGTDEASLTRALIEGRRMMREYETFYKTYLNGYENMELVATASLPGIRETRRITGDYILSLKDFEARAVFSDEIGRFSYPVDIHASTPDTDAFDRFVEEYRSLRYEPGESYGIPYRTLTPLGLDNVFVAGRCVSTDRYVQGSIRVNPGCFITGQAAGVAAAAAVQGGTDTRGISTRNLQARLLAMGMYLPHAQT